VRWILVKIRHYLYNSFVLEDEGFKIAIDPGATFLYHLRLKSLIPKSEWPDITHIFVTHGDPDHFWHFDRVARASGAVVILNKTMTKNVEGRNLALAPRRGGLAFTTPVEKLHTISVGESIELDGLSVAGVKATHGPLMLRFGPFSKTFRPGPGERVGWGAIGFKVELLGKSVVNLGDTLLHLDEWSALGSPDVLMIPIGGRVAHNTMDEDEALQAVKLMHPKHVIPCHYNCPAFFSSKYNPADAEMFKREVEAMGIECTIMGCGDEINV
jgi:L-ascorbate metabolism protein UlaG (beta-lactamase superfamily)